MIEVEEVNNEKRKLRFYLIDAHHHIGEDTDEHRNLNINGSFDFFRNIWSLLNSKYEEYFKSESFPSYFQPKFKISRNFPSKPLAFLNSESIYNSSWIFDQFIAFPFHDKFREKPRNDGKIVEYNSSNTRIARIVSDKKSGNRLIGYCRVNPLNEELSLEEIDRSIGTLGLSGIKLHPISDNWNERKYFEEDFIWIYHIFRKAIKYNIPVIFDCRFTTTLKWIYKLTLNVEREFLRNGFKPNYIHSRLKIIIAHIGFLREDDNLLAEILSHPCINGDLTGQFSTKIKDLLITLSQNIKCPYENVNEMEEKLYWSKKVLLGSDFNYFESFHIVDQLLYLFSEDFYSLIEGNLDVIQNILSGNIFRLLPNDLPIKPRTHKPNLKKGSFLIRLNNENDYIQFMNAILTYLSDTQEKEDKNPHYFRISQDIHLSQQSYEPTSFYSQNFKIQSTNFTSPLYFYFNWNKFPLILAGIIPDIMNMYYIYLFNKNTVQNPSFEGLKDISKQVSRDDTKEILSDHNAIKNLIDELINNSGVIGNGSN